MTKPTLVAIVGYIDASKNSGDELSLITFAGRVVTIPKKSIISTHKLEVGSGDSGPFRIFVESTTVIRADMFVTDLIHGETHWSSDTALAPRQGMRPSDVPLDGQTHWSHDTA